MDRRDYLTALHTALLAFAGGCLTAPDSATTTTTDPATATTTPSPERIALVVNNGRDTPLDVTLTVTRDGDSVYRERVAVDAGERRSVDPGIDAPGAYELTVTLADGTERVRPFDIEDYDLRMGSNLVVEVGDRIRVLVEE